MNCAITQIEKKDSSNTFRGKLTHLKQKICQRHRCAWITMPPINSRSFSILATPFGFDMTPSWLRTMFRTVNIEEMLRYLKKTRNKAATREKNWRITNQFLVIFWIPCCDNQRNLLQLFENMPTVYNRPQKHSARRDWTVKNFQMLKKWHRL